MNGQFLLGIGRVGAAALIVGFKLTVLFCGAAIFLGAVLRPSRAFVECDRPEPQPVEAGDADSTPKYIMQRKEESVVANLALHDPTGKQVLTATYCEITGMTYLIVGSGQLRTCVWARPDGGVSFCANSRIRKYEVDVRDDAERGLQVTESNGPGWAPGEPPRPSCDGWDPVAERARESVPGTDRTRPAGR